jgi:hypothetical protein
MGTILQSFKRKQVGFLLIIYAIVPGLGSSFLTAPLQELNYREAMEASAVNASL